MVLEFVVAFAGCASLDDVDGVDPRVRPFAVGLEGTATSRHILRIRRLFFGSSELRSTNGNVNFNVRFVPRIARVHHDKTKC